MLSSCSVLFFWLTFHFSPLSHPQTARRSFNDRGVSPLLSFKAESIQWYRVLSRLYRQHHSAAAMAVLKDNWPKLCVCFFFFNLIYMLYNVSECLHLSRKFTSSEKTRITSLMVSILLKGANTVNWKMLKEIRKSINKIHATKSKNQNFTMHLFLIYFKSY